MRAVKSKDTTPELFVRKLVFKKGYRYRLHCKDLPGNPDITFRNKHKVIFVNGCFWHGHCCKRGDRIPKTNNNYWVEKIQKNKLRDENNIKKLKDLQYSVLVIWECEIKNWECEIKNLKKVEKKIISFLES